LAGHGGNARKGQGKCLLPISSHFSTGGSHGFSLLIEELKTSSEAWNNGMKIL
jgi:hypothetical protein